MLKYDGNIVVTWSFFKAMLWKRLSRRFELVTHGFELVTRGFELVTRNSCFTFPCFHNYYPQLNYFYILIKTANMFLLCIKIKINYKY